MTTIQTPAPAAAFALAGCAAQHAGDRREQQDRVAILRGKRAPRCALAVLADGLGGRGGGAGAAQQVIATAASRFDSWSPDDGPADAFLAELVAEAHVVLKLSGTMAGRAPDALPGATLVALLVQPARVDWCHVGDSRLYHVRDGRLRVRTRDDTWLEHLASRRPDDPARATFHPSARRLMQAIGVDPAPRPRLGGLDDPRAGDAFVLCSDGAWNPLSDAEIASALAGGAPREACETLLGLVREREAGHGDNASLVVVALRPVED